MDNCSTDIRFIPAHSTHLLQPADSVVIQKSKAAWSGRCQQHKAQMLQVMADGTEPRNGMLQKSRKGFLRLVADEVRDVNRMCDIEGLAEGQKAMIRCGFAKQPNELWEVRQLFPHLQGIVANHRANFDGASPDNN